MLVQNHLIINSLIFSFTSIFGTNSEKKYNEFTIGDKDTVLKFIKGKANTQTYSYNLNRVFE